MKVGRDTQKIMMIFFFLWCGGGKQYDRLFREVVDAPSLHVFKVRSGRMRFCVTSLFFVTGRVGVSDKVCQKRPSSES